MLKVLSIIGLLTCSSMTFATNIIKRCDLNNGRTVTVSLQNGIPTYRYSKGKNIEITLPKTANPNHVKYANFMFSGGGGEYYRFINGDYSYVVYTGAGRGWERDEVIVYKGQKKLTTIKCKSTFTSNTTWSGQDTQYDESDSNHAEIFGD